jgi:hypothetical protein
MSFQEEALLEELKEEGTKGVIVSQGGETEIRREAGNGGVQRLCL